MPAKLVVLIESMGGGGAQQVVAELLKHWVHSGKDVHLITFQGIEKDIFDVPSQVKRHIALGDAVSSNFLSGLISNLWRIIVIRSFLRKSGASVALSFITSTNILTIIASMGLNLRVIVSERNDPNRQDILFRWRVLRSIVYPFADLVTANSKMAVRALTTKLSARLPVWLPNPIRRPTSNSVANTQSRILLAVGRLHPQKNYEDLLEAFALVESTMPDWTLRILGSGPDEKLLRATCHRLGISKRVEFLGFISDPFPHYRAAEVFVMVSRYEGSPNALWEAMSCGLPSIISDAIEGALEIVLDGRDVRVVRAGDIGALADALKELINNPSLRCRLGKEAKLTVEQFATETVFQAWDNVLLSKD